MRMDTPDITAPSDSLTGPAALEKAEFERELALALQKRLADENHRLEYRIAELEAERATLKSRLDEAESYLRDVKSSKPWRLVQFLRGLVGRRW
jgi:hypothetical protein